MNDGPPVPTRMSRWSDAAFGLAMVSLCTCGGFGVLPLLAIYCGWRGLRQIAASDGALFGRQHAIIGLVLAVSAIIVFIVASSVFFTARGAVRRAVCVKNVTSVNLALMQYAQDYDGWLPAAGIDWRSAIESYTGGPLPLQCLSHRASPSYFLAPDLVGRNLQDAYDKSASPHDHVVIFESDDGHNVAWRHSGFAVFAYLDGHVSCRTREDPPFGYGEAPGGSP